MTDRKRSDEVRGRRAQRNSDRKPARKKASRRSSAVSRDKRRGGSSSSREMPAMVSRRGVMASPPKSGRSRKETRRRYDVALPAVGAELRLPSMPRVHFGWRLLSFLMVVSLMWALYAVWTSPRFMVSSIGVEGLTRIPQHEIEAILDVTGMSIFAVNPEQALGRLVAAFPDLSDVVVTVGFPAQVQVLVTERAPVIAWEFEGVTYWVDLDGYSFVPRGELDLVHVIASVSPPAPPIALNVLETALDGREMDELSTEEFALLTEQIGPRPYMTPELVHAILDLYPHAPKDGPLVYHPQRGLGWLDEAHGWKVYFGSRLDRLDERLNVYAAIVARFEADRIPAKLISVEFLHAPYYRFTDE